MSQCVCMERVRGDKKKEKKEKETSKKKKKKKPKEKAEKKNELHAMVKSWTVEPGVRKFC